MTPNQDPSERPVILHFEKVPQKMLAEEHYEKLVQGVIAAEGKALQKIAYVFVSDETLRDMNEEHLDHTAYTDILTFPYAYDPVVSDIYISVDRISENAGIHDTSLMDELHRVMIHGLLHMCGWDDQTDEQKTAMREREAHYLRIWREAVR